jgi:uncharacterized protein (TIGR02996 family)
MSAASEDRPAVPGRPEVLAFLAEIKERPDEDAARLVLADWLEEYGDPADAARAELVRLQVRQAGLPAGDPERLALGGRERDLQRRWEAAWLGPLRERVRSVEYDRGLVALTLTCGVLCSHSLRALQGSEAWAWVLGGQVEGDSPAPGSRLAGCPLLGDWVRLSFVSRASHSCPLGTQGVGALARSPWLGRMLDLELQANDIDDAGARALADSPSLGRLRELDLTANQLSDAGLAALVAPACRFRLQRLNLARNAIGDAGAVALGASPAVAELRELDLGDNRLTNAGARALADSPWLGRLTRLWLWGNFIGAEGVERLVARFGAQVVFARSGPGTEQGDI